MTIKKFFDNFEEYLCVLGTAVMTAVVFLQVIMRYIFSNSLSWSEELARFVFLWISWVGASYAVKTASHFRVEMFVNIFKGRARKYLEIFVLIVWFLFCFFLAWHGTKLVLFLVETNQSSAAMRIPMSVPYASVPVGCALMCVRLVIEMARIVKGGYPPEKGGAAEGGL
ncbi:MAG: TRAP transporter small permease [Synergistaceae bacterium]|nr:TRAP transporter small permease [Synergistaceae bacterium]